MKKEFMKKLTALFLTIAMAVGMAMTVSAIRKDETGTIQITGAEAKVKVTAYRLMDVNYDFDGNQPVDPVYSWVDGAGTTEVADWVRSEYSAYIGAVGDNSVQEAFNKEKRTEIAKFYDALAAAVRGGEITGLTGTTGTADSAGAVNITNLTMGNYLVLVENGLKVYSPSAVNLVPKWDDASNSWIMSDPAVVNLKPDELSITKEVDDKTTEIGGTVNYTVTVDVPRYPENTLAGNKIFDIYDTLSTGLTLNPNSIQVVGLAGTDETPLTAVNHYTLTTENAVDRGNNPVSYRLAFTYDNLKKSNQTRFEKIRVTYSAQVNGNALVMGDKDTDNFLGNTAKLTYSNNPYGMAGSTKDQTASARVYTYGIDISKVDKATRALLPGAEFKLSTDEEGNNVISFFETGDGVYRKALAGETGVEILEVGAADSGTQVGKLTLNGLDTGTYYLTETKAPEEYNKLNSPVAITITDTDTVNGIVNDGANGADGENGLVELDVENSKGFQLPETGGMGTIIFTAVGVLLIGIGALVLVFVFMRRRRS